MRLIDADALIKKCGEWYTEEGPEEGYIGPLKHLLNKQPTIEPKQGEWIDYTFGSGCYCSNCGWDGDDIIDECIIQDFDFCPNCGARTRGADDGEMA